MLREIYIAFGSVGTFFAAILMCATVLSWFLAITGTVLRQQAISLKTGIVVAISLFPPLSVGVLLAYLRAERKHRVASRKAVLNQLQSKANSRNSAYPAQLIPIADTISR